MKASRDIGEEGRRRWTEGKGTKRRKAEIEGAYGRKRRRLAKGRRGKMRAGRRKEAEGGEWKRR